MPLMLEEDRDPSSVPRHVSVALSTFDSARPIRRAVRSFFEQTHRNLELIVVDDSSQGENPDVVASLAGNDGRIVSVRLPSNAARCAERSVGLELAKGDYIAFLDSDEARLPWKLALQMDVFAGRRRWDCAEPT